MANLYDSEGHQRPIVVRIPRFEIGEHFTIYSIEIGLGQFKWSVNRRFSEFASLHEDLVTNHKLRDLELPAKRLFGNQSVTFVQKRQKELEEYLSRVFKIFGRPPSPLSRFSLWDRYEVHGITATMSAYVLGMATSQNSGTTAQGQWRQQPFEFSVLQVHAINARVTSPAPTNDLDHMKFDVGHIMNFVTHLSAVRIWGSSRHFGTSSIVMNQLPYDLGVFKEIESLQLINVDLTRLKGLDQLKQTLVKLSVHSTLQTLKELLLQDLIDSDLGQDSTVVQCWSRIIEADFSENSLRTIDESIKLLPNVQRLNLSGNQIPAITHLEHLSELQRLDLSKNGITDLINLNAKLGNIKELVLVENRLTSLLGLSRAYSLQTLDVSKNQISQIIEVCHIGRLPCLEYLKLTDNPVTLVPDYRTKVFEQFGDRATELRLDGKRGTQKELDTAAVLMALQRAKEPRAAHRNGTSPIVTASGSRRTSQDIGTPRGASPAVRPNSLLPERGTATGASGEKMDREKMESMRSRGGKQWLVEYNQIMDQQERQQQAPSSDEPEGITRLTLDRQPSRPDPEESAAASGDLEALPSVQFETRVEQALARLLHRPCCPELAFCAPALPLLSAAAEAALIGPHTTPADVSGLSDEPAGRVPSGGAVAFTRDGRLLVLLRQEDGELVLALNLEAANLAQVVRGFRGLYLRLEERFAGPDGVTVLLTMDGGATERLAELLSRHSGLAVVSLDGQRQRHLTEFATQQEGAFRHANVGANPGPETFCFYAVALFRGAGLRQLVSLMTSRRRLHLLDERMASLPAPLGGSGGSGETFASLGSYRRQDLRLPAFKEEEPQVGEGEDAFFKFPLRVPLQTGRPGGLEELRLDFHSKAQREQFAAALEALREDEEEAKGSPQSVKSEKSAPIGPTLLEQSRQFAFERWDALSAAVKHRVAQSPSSACPLRRLIDMDSARLAGFFAKHVQPQLSSPTSSKDEDETAAPPLTSERWEEPEELLAVMWAYWLHYRTKAPETLACVFLTTRGIYVVFDPTSAEDSLAFKSLTHRRSVGEGSDAAQWSVSVFSFHLSSLACVYVGPFNQYLRLSGQSPDQDFTLITRDFRLSENLLNYLRKLFRGSGGASMASSLSSSDGTDPVLEVYRSSHQSSIEQLGSNGVGGNVEIRFPNDEILSELLFVLEEAIQPPTKNDRGLSSSPHGAVLDSSPSLLYYLLLENLSIDLVDYVKCCTSDHLMSVLILAGSGHLVLLRQNVSQYPIPDFARGPPEVAQFSVLEVRPLACLTHLTLSSCDRRLLTLSFAPQGALPGTLTTQPASPGLETAPSRATPDIGDPVHVTSYIQNPRDVDKLVKLLRAAWKEHTGASQELPVHRS